MFYEIPTIYFLPLHHPRPRFKDDIENVLIYFASEIVRLGFLPKEDFIKGIENSIRRYPGNLHKKSKTIANWRTEIDALFGFIVSEGDTLGPSPRAIELATHQDLVKFFKWFCYYFKYPGGFVKPERNLEFIKYGVNFRPVSYILTMLYTAEKKSDSKVGISKAETAHCIFNDLRVTRDHRPVQETWRIIADNREKGIAYNWAGDVIRYAGDILDYMVQANLLTQKFNNLYYVNHLEDIAIQRYITPEDDFDYYTKVNIDTVTLDDLRQLDCEWFHYFNTVKDDGFFDTNLIALFTDESTEYEKLEAILKDFMVAETNTTGGIGSVGESLILTHEKKRIEKEGRPDLKHLIKLIPSTYSVGYDINSVEISGHKRLIEVKTTASASGSHFNRFHLTPNEWDAAQTYGKSYFVYRLLVRKGDLKLTLIDDPVGKYKSDLLTASPRDGMDVIFDPEVCGYEVEILI